MEIDRRKFIRCLAGGFLGVQLPVLPCFATDKRIYLSACADVTGQHRVCGFSPRGELAFDLVLPGRGHSFAMHPIRHQAVNFARRPGRFAYVIDLVRGTIMHEFASPGNRHFYGHGVFSHDGHLLYASENDFERDRGVIGIYDAGNQYTRVAELPSHGIGPHDIRLLSDGDTLVVANGGILTRPELPRVKLNLPTMLPSLCFVDRHHGRLLQEFRLEPELYQLSIRHLAIAMDDTTVIAMQYEGPAGDLVPLVALCDASSNGNSLHLLQGPPDILRAMKQYCGSVCFDSSSRIIAVSAPRGNLVTFWSLDTRTYLSSTRVTDGCGVAAASQAGEFLTSSGRGGVVVIDAWSGKSKPLEADILESSRWDNHLAMVNLA